MQYKNIYFSCGSFLSLAVNMFHNLDNWNCDSCPKDSSCWLWSRFIPTDDHRVTWLLLKTPNQVTFTVTAAQHRGGLQESRGSFIVAQVLDSSYSLVDKQNSWRCGGRAKPLYRLEDTFPASLTKFRMV